MAWRPEVQPHAKLVEGKPKAELKSRTELEAEGRSEKLDDNSGAGGSRGLDGSSQGDGTRKSCRNNGRGRFPDRIGTSR